MEEGPRRVCCETMCYRKHWGGSAPPEENRGVRKGHSWVWLGQIPFVQGYSGYMAEYWLERGRVKGAGLVAQSRPTLWDPTDCSPPGSSVHGDSPDKEAGVGYHALLPGIFQPRDRTQVSCIAGRLFTTWATTRAQVKDGGGGIRALVLKIKIKGQSQEIFKRQN